jgi:hypothetical protein
MKPKQPKPNPPTEDQEQMLLAEYLNNRFGYHGWVHVPNQRWAKVHYLRKLSKMGVKKGFPDILIFGRAMIPYPKPCNRGKHLVDGLALELKRQKGNRATLEQRIWLAWFGEHNWAQAVAYGAQDAITKIEEVYGKWTK